jgi:hypothetical protein
MHMDIMVTTTTNIQVIKNRAYWALFNKSIKTRYYNEIVSTDCLNLEKSVSA